MIGSKYTYRQLHKADLQRGVRKRYDKFLIKCFRKCQTSHNFVSNLFYRFVFMCVKSKRCIDIYGKCDIGPGLYMGHMYGITINENVVIGKNCNIHKGVTIGQENRGPRKGTPVIGDEVWFGVNATVVGKIRVGNDVMIAPNSFVNCDVPDHSIVYGNPCIIKHRDNATEGYINNKCSLV